MARVGFCGSGAAKEQEDSHGSGQRSLPIELPWFFLPAFLSHPSPVVQSASKCCPFCLEDVSWITPSSPPPEPLFTSSHNCKVFRLLSWHPDGQFAKLPGGG